MIAPKQSPSCAVDFAVLVCGGSGEPLDIGRTSAATRHSQSGSIYGVGGRFQSFKINDLGMVDQTGIEPSPKAVRSD